MTNLLLTALSAVLVAAGVLALRRLNSSRLYRGVFLTLAIASILLMTATLLATHFTGEGINKATIFHLRYGLGGAGFWEYRWQIGAALLALLAACYWIVVVIRSSGLKHRSERHGAFALVPVALLCLSLLANPAGSELYQLHRSWLSVDDRSAAEVTASFYKYYRTPNLTATINSTKNLVFIYAESLERTYFDQNLFPGLITKLRELESTSTYFTNIEQVSGTGWTIAGMTASQCGIPLVTPSDGNSMSGMDEFLPSAVCLGDLLSAQGYELVYLGGASLDFAGKGKFFETHGFVEVHGRESLLPLVSDPDYTNAWGLYDDSLFDLAFRRFTKLSASGQLFGLFTLTLDTHHPGGHPSARCEAIKYGDGSNPILNAVACSDQLIFDFIKRIVDSQYADDTIIVLASDHLAMRNTAYRVLQRGDRKNLLMIIDPAQAGAKEVAAAGSTLDIGTTLLPFLGYSGDIGLGRDLLSEHAADTERLAIHASITSWSMPLTGFWDFPRLRRSLSINIDERRIAIDGRTMRMPILIQMDRNLQTTLRFALDGNPRRGRLIDQLSELPTDNYFLLIDECDTVAERSGVSTGDGYCILAGGGDEDLFATRLDTNVTYSADEIKEALGLSNGFLVHRIAHAGGGIDEQTYTNSLDALDHNRALGFRYFEIDFSFTTDAQLVCLHDWNDSFTAAFGEDAAGGVALAEFEALVATRSKYRICTANSLATWMQANSGTYLVTDIKERNLEGLRQLLQIIPDAVKRVIPQVHNPEELAMARELGFRNVIWTLYRYRQSNEDVLRSLQDFRQNIAVAMPRARAKSGLPKQLLNMRIPSYVHTINSPVEERSHLSDYGVSEIYTDFLAP